MVYVSFSLTSSSGVSSGPSTHLPNSHEWHVREAAGCHLPYLGLNLLINREQMAAILLSTWPYRDTRHCCFKQKRYKSSNNLSPQVLNFDDREKSGHRPLSPSLLNTQARGRADLQRCTGTCAAAGWHPWPLRWH